MAALGVLALAAWLLTDFGHLSSTSTPSTGDSSVDAKDANKIAPIRGASGVEISVGSKNFTEQFILGEIYAQALEAAGYTVKTNFSLGPKVARALGRGQIDAYPEYTGVALTSFFGVKIADVPRDARQAYNQAKADYAKVNITALAPTPFQNTYGLAMTRFRAAELDDPTTISDLSGKAQDLTIASLPECRRQVECLLGVQQAYGLTFKTFLSSQNSYESLDTGKADVAFVYTSDGRLSTGKYVLLDDDKSIFPPYNVSFTVRNATARKLGVEGQKVITDVQKDMSEETMQKLSARVAIDGEQPKDVATDYLKQFGFVN